MKHALITGGLGFIGSFIARHLLEKDIVDKVVLLDHYGKYVNPVRERYFDYRRLRIAKIEKDIVIERGDARFYSIVHEIVYKYNPTYIFHLAALPLAKLDNLTTDEAWEGTIVSTSNLLQAVANIRKHNKTNLRRFVYTSSSMVYGDFQSDIATEQHPTNPKEPYGTMKLAGEEVTRGLSRYFNIDATIIRPSAVYGPTDMNQRVTQIYVEKTLRGEKLSIFGKDEKLDFTYVKDLAKGFVLAALSEKAIGETFNMTYGKAHTLLDFVLVLKELFPDLDYEVTERDAFRPSRGTLSIEKAKRLLGFNPEYDLKRGIKEYVEFVKNHNPILQKSYK